jgi:hypothetical protein
MLMRRASREPVVTNELPDGLKARIAAAEADSASRDFDAASYLRMALLGAVIPLGLIVLGWILLP